MESDRQTGAMASSFRYRRLPALSDVRYPEDSRDLFLLGRWASQATQTMNRSIQPRAMAPSGVKNKPFASKWVCALGGQEGEVFVGAFCRDAAGRIRFEFHSSNGEEMIIIADYDSGELNFLQPATREVVQDSVGMGLKNWAFSKALPCYTDEYKVIQGIRCRRVILREPETKADAGETWVSDEHLLVMMDIGTVNGLLRDWRVVHIDLGEPAVDLFVVPPDYRAVREWMES